MIFAMVVFVVAVASFVVGTIYGRKAEVAVVAEANKLKDSAKAEVKNILHL